MKRLCSVKRGISLFILLTGTAHAVLVQWSGGSSSNNWNEASSWSTDHLPGATTSDSAIFASDADSTMLVSSFVFTNASSMTVRDEAELTFRADLSGVNQLYLAPNAGVAGGTVLHEAGTVICQTVKVGSSATALSESLYSASGGELRVSGELYVNNGTFCVSGSAGAVWTDSLTTTSMGELKFQLDDAGVSPIVVTNEFSINAASQLTIDGSDFSGHGTYDLVRFGSIAGAFDSANVEIAGVMGASIVYEDDCMNLLIPEHAATTVIFSNSALWSSVDIYPEDFVEIERDATVTVDVDGFADSIVLNGALEFALNAVGNSSLTVSNGLQFGAGWAIHIDGADYDGFDGYFPVLQAPSLPANVTHEVTLSGFGEREPALVLQEDGLWLRLIAMPSLSARLCSLVPASTVAPDYTNREFSVTRALHETGSAWQPSFHEAHVMDTTLTHTVPGSPELDWGLTVGRGGQIASFRNPAIGEMVPPQWQHKSWPGGSDRSPWVDEVWQGVSIATAANNASDSNWFIHQAGVYLFDTDVQTKPFYSPMVASSLDASAASFTCINWGQQAHTSNFSDDDTTNDFQSHLLYFTRVQDLGQGVIEVSLGFYNYGEEKINRLNVPWGGIRLTSLGENFLAKPDGSWANATDGWDGDEQRSKDYDEMGGWMAFCNSTNGITPAMAVVFGHDAEPALEQLWGKGSIWWTQTTTNYEAGETESRNYGVFATIARYNIPQGNGVWARYYFALGSDVDDLATRIEARGLLNESPLTPFDYTEASTPLVAYKIQGSGASFRIEENGQDPDFFLYAHPVTGSFPVYEILEKDETRYLTWNPYETGVIKTYDGTLAGMRLLGFSLPMAMVSSSSYAYASLDAVMASASENYLPSGELLSVRSATAQEAWRVEHFGFTENSGDSADTANPDEDDLNNLEEYAFGGNPTNAADIGYRPAATTTSEDGTNWFNVVYARRTTLDSGLLYTLESRTNLAATAWNPAIFEEVEETGTVDVQFESVTNRIDTADKPHEFIRLKVTTSTE